MTTPLPERLLTTRETAEAEQQAMAAGTSGWQLMERAGEAAAAICAATPNASSAAVLCGPGNNGGDGFVVARRLSALGWRVEVFALDEAGAWHGDAARARGAWPGPIRSATHFDPRSCDLVVDALFGAGLTRPLGDLAAAVVDSVNASGRPVIAVDMPSGVDGTTGAVRGAAVKAMATVTFGTAKPGHYLFPGRGLRGRLHVADIGLAPPDATPGTFLNASALWIARLPRPEPDGHKYKRGHAVVMSGGVAETGAARLAARAALRVGAGLVTLATPASALLVNASQLTAIMVRVADGPDGLADLLADARKNVVILGPGLGVGDATRALVETALEPRSEAPGAAPERACLLDADALTSFAGHAERLRALIAAAPGPVVITPHDGEFARLFSTEAGVQVGSKLERCRAAARFLGCTVLLKGPDTVVAAPDGRAAVSDGDAPWLATAGSGDVLSGLIGGLLTQGMPPFEAATAGDYLHTASARLFGPGLIAEDLPETLPRALRALYEPVAVTPDLR